jgi:flagellar hook protein FlgE
MGIFGALTTAVGGLRANAYALENVSGNIANSQTTAFKRIDTSFRSLQDDSPSSSWPAASPPIRADQHRAGRHPEPSIHLHGDQRRRLLRGQKPASPTNRPNFTASTSIPPRRLQPDKSGYLVNGAGYFLMGIPIDPTTGNLVGSVPRCCSSRTASAGPGHHRSTTAPTWRLSADPVDDVTCRLGAAHPATSRFNPIAGAAVAKITGTGGDLPDAARLADRPTCPRGPPAAR